MTAFRTYAALIVGGIMPVASAVAQTPLSGERLSIARLTSPVTIDGDLADEAWQRANPIERWYEIIPGDNVEPKVSSVAYLAYDDRFLYVAFRFQDSNPGAIRAPYGDRDRLNSDSTDFGGLFIDARNDGHSAVILLVSPSGVQYDAVTDDAASEDASPDFFWDSAARIVEDGWTLEMRVPFSSLRYRDVNPQTWGILLYRNYPRDFRYQIASARFPRGSNCTVCRLNTLVGLEGLPSEGHTVIAPYASATSVARATEGAGSPLSSAPVRPRGGVDIKWTPNADTAVDFTAKPDFSQIESDTAQITANERFALSFPEKRPFFLEGIELLSTPIRAVYTRSVTNPRWGSRLTGKSRGVSYTALISEDAGGGSRVVPGPNSSLLLPQDESSYALIARAKRDVGRSFLSMLVTDRELNRGAGYNRVVGPDFQWRYSLSDVVTGQWLFTATKTPTQSLSSHGGDIEWRRNKTHLELASRYKDFGDGFRADNGFVPQVGYREVFGRGGWTVRPTGFVRQLQLSVNGDRQVDRAGVLISRSLTPEAEMNVRWSGFLRFRFIDDDTRSQDRTFRRRQFGYVARFSPSPRVTRVSIEGTAGEEIDFVNSRLGTGATVNVNGTFNVTRRLELELLQNQRWLDIGSASERKRLFTATISRVRSTYMFTANSFVRLIGQYVSTTQDPSLFGVPVRPRTGVFGGSVLVAYKINWQSVLFLGYGDDRELSEQNRMAQTGRQFFVKASYAFQH